MRVRLSTAHGRIIIGALLMLLSILGVGRDRYTGTFPKADSKCQLIDGSKQPIYITFEKVEKNSSKDKFNGLQIALLRLHNNLNSAILIPTETEIETKLPNGETTFDLQDESRVTLNFIHQDLKRQKTPQFAYAWGDLVILSHLPAGRSIVFGVPLSYIKKSRVGVTFYYEWESRSIGNGTLIHYVFLNSDELPEYLAP